VRLCEEKGRLMVEFLNDRASSQQREFFPRSLNERASDLGGRVSVENRADGFTRVAVEIPI
jgi:signal transduction histidine kinase